MSASARPPLTKSPLNLARVALAVGQASLPVYSSAFSRKDYTQPQLFALLVLRQFYRSDYRGLTTRVAEHAELRAALGLCKTPHFTTLQKAESRLVAGGFSTNCSALFSLARELVA